MGIVRLAPCWFTRALLLTGVLALPAAAWCQPAADSEAVRLLRSDSRAPYVHRLTLYDHSGKAIDPSDPEALPYSPRATCTKCHAYAEIACGWHFSAAAANTTHGRPGEPWVYVDARTGTQLPLSYRGWPGTYRPDAVGVTDFGFVQHFGRHTTGGGVGEPDPKAIEASPEAKRWQISGVLEIDCMICHSADRSYDAAEHARQVELQNYRWAPTAALGLAAVRGEARGVSDEFDPEVPPSPDRRDLVLPKVEYNRTKFDSDDRVFFDIVRDPPAERCYQCHTTRAVGQRAPPAWHDAGDVHLSAGMSCTDCHAHGIDHRLIRGYESERRERPGESLVTALSCRGCHLGTEGVSDGAEPPAGQESESRGDGSPPSTSAASVVDGLGGRHGAPRPEHAGIPPLHFERMTCTACHSGPWPEDFAQQVQTSMAHGLGLGSRDRTAETPPHIVEPVFGRDDAGRIEPRRMLWPAFWGRLVNGGVSPIPLGAVDKAADKVFGRRRPKAGHVAPPPTPEQVEQMLAALAPARAEDGQAVYVRDGRLTRIAAAGGLESAAHPAVQPYSWALAHDVRPAQQSLGVRGCTDCHAADSPILVGSVASDAQHAARLGGPRSMDELHGYDRRLSRAWARSFALREAFKIAGFACLAVVAAAMLRVLLTARAPALGPTAPGAPPSGARGGLVAQRVATLATVLGVIALTVSSFVTEWFGGRVAGRALLLHVTAAPVFLAGLTLSAVLRAWASPRPIGSRWQNVLTGAFLLCGLIVAGTMLAAMLPVFGYNSQRALIAWHEGSAVALLVIMLLQGSAALAARRARK